MSTEPCAIRLDLRLDGDALTGRARGNDGAARDFSGWLGLVAAIDSLLTATPPTGPDGLPAAD